MSEFLRPHYPPEVYYKQIKNLWSSPLGVEITTHQGVSFGKAGEIFARALGMLTILKNLAEQVERIQKTPTR